MSLFKRGRFYWYEFVLNGRRYRESTKRTNRQAAQTVESLERNKLLNSLQGVPTPTAVPTLAEVAENFLEWAKTNLAKSTVTLHRVNIDRLKQFFRGKLLTEIDLAAVEAFKNWRAGQERKNGPGKVSAATTNRNLTTLKRIFNYAESMGVNVRNPVKHIKYFQEHGRLRALTVEDVEQYLAESKGDLHDFAVLATELGGRPMELLALHKKDVHLEGEFHYVCLPGTKTRKSLRVVPLADAAKEVLQRRTEKSPNGYVFPLRRKKTKNTDLGHVTNIRKAHEAIIKKHFKAEPFTLYTFRHTLGTRCAEAGVEPSALMELMGHTSLAMTSKYIHPARKQKIAAIDQLQKYVKLAKQLKEHQREDNVPVLEEGEEITVHDEMGESVRISYPHNSPHRQDSTKPEDAFKSI